MCSIHLLPRWGSQNLTAVAACGHEDDTEDVDQYMEPERAGSSSLTAPLVERLGLNTSTGSRKAKSCNGQDEIDGQYGDVSVQAPRDYFSPRLLLPHPCWRHAQHRKLHVFRSG